MDLTPTLSGVEALRIVMGVIALLFTIRSWWRAVGNRRALFAVQQERADQGRPPLDDGYRVSADLDIRWRGVMIFVQSALLLLGVRAAFYPPASTDLTWDAWLGGALFMAMQGALVWVTLRNDRAEAGLAHDYRGTMRASRPPPPRERTAE